jgi:hypothetical protein
MTEAELIQATRNAIRGIGVSHTPEAAARRIVRADQQRRFRARNVMTPTRIDCRILNAGDPDKNTTLVEISMGDFMNNPIFGLTVFDLRLDMEPRDDELSTAAFSPEEVAEKLRAIAAA